jgi:hypothetical protein
MDMDMNTYVMIGIAVLSMFFGYFFGLFEGRGQGYKKRKKEEEEGIATETTGEGDEPQQSQDTPPLADLPAELPEIPEMLADTSLMRLSQTPDGSLRLDLDDARVDTNALTREQRGRLIALLTAMRPWLETGQPASPAPRPRPAAPPVSPASGRPDAAHPSASGNRPAAAPAEEPVVVEEPPTSPQSIVSQIDSILQLRIAGTALRDKGIKLQESPEGGVLVWVGLDKFQSVEEVPDEAIKSAIRAAIVEWEDKYTPNG